MKPDLNTVWYCPIVVEGVGVSLQPLTQPKDKHARQMRRQQARENKSINKIVWLTVNRAIARARHERHRSLSYQVEQLAQTEAHPYLHWASKIVYMNAIIVDYDNHIH